MRVIQSLLLVTTTILTAHCIVIKPDCTATLCLRPECNDNQELVTLDGECCPTCQPKSSTLPPPGQIDCSAVLCLRPECLDNQKLVTPEGQCCPKCVSTTEDCPFEGQVRAICEPCETTCIQFRNGNQRICPAICRLTNSSCECPGGQIVDIVNRRCVSPNECPNPCATVDCLPNSICKVDASGEAFCEPSCSLNNGGCLKNQTCSLEDVQCVRAPCPPVIKCTYDPCSECTANQICRRTVAPCLVPPCPETTQCLDRKAVCLSPPVTGPCRARFLRYFYNNTSGQCERFVYGGCQGNANNFLTSEACGNDCQVSVSPVSPCALIFCANGFRCEVSGGEGFCQPDCSLNNGGCLKDETCRLEDVTCVTTPCPKSRICDKPPTTPPCPPTCTKDFCRRRGNRKALCSKPGPRELPGCTGSCNLSYCSACYFSDNFVSTLPGNCSTCPLSDYTSDTRCFRRWASCTGYAHWRIHGRPHDRSQENFKCYSPPCPLRG